MSRLQGYVTVSYAALVREFGDPGDPHDPDKSHVQWHLDSPYVGNVTIYDYGALHECDGNWHIPMAEPVEWHIGGRDRAAADWARRCGWTRTIPSTAAAVLNCCRGGSRNAARPNKNATRLSRRPLRTPPVSPDAAPPDAAAAHDELPQHPPSQLPTLIGP